VHSEGVEDNDEVDGEAGDRNGEYGDQDGHEGGDQSEPEDLVDGVFAMDTINDSVLSDDEGADTTVTDQSLVEDVSYQTSAHSDVKFSNSISPHGGTASSGHVYVDWDNAEYRFDVSVLRKGDALQTKCTYCGEENHIVDNCTAEQVTRKVKPLPPVPDWFINVLTKVCFCCKGKNFYSFRNV
jgi:hypothetical protein